MCFYTPKNSTDIFVNKKMSEINFNLSKCLSKFNKCIKFITFNDENKLFIYIIKLLLELF